MPQGACVVFVSEQLLAQFADWHSLVAPEPYEAIEARVAPTDSLLVVEIFARYKLYA